MSAQITVGNVLSSTGTAFITDNTTYTFPAAVSKVRVFVWGAGGSGGGSTGCGGSGAYVEGDIDKGSMTTLTIYLNRAGGGHGPGGGAVSGGGYGAVYNSTNGYLMVAGAGGSGFGGYGYYGGGGGYLQGFAGGSPTLPGAQTTARNRSNGGGGSQTQGGQGGWGNSSGLEAATDGSYLTGGNGVLGTSYGSGGGGGYYGGGGGNGNGYETGYSGAGAGGGGSSYINTGFVKNYKGADGQNGTTSSVLPGGSSSPFYVSGYGVGTYNGAGGGALVVIVPYLSGGGGATTSTAPAQISFKSSVYTPPKTGLYLWLDAADSSSFTLSGSTLQSINDKSGTGKTMTVASAPTYNATGFNSKPCFVFASGNSITCPLNDVTTQDIMMVAVWKQTQNSMGSPFSLGQAGSGSEVGLLWHSGEGRYLSYTYGGGDSHNSSVSYNVNVIQIGIKLSAMMSCWINGTVGDTASSARGNTASTIYVGGGSWAMIGQVAEILFYVGTISTSTRQQIEGYLAWKWGLQNSLASGHPYRSLSLTGGSTPSQITLGSSSIRALGGVTTIYNTYKIHTFATAGTATFTVTPPNALTVKVLVVGGGGGGGSSASLYGGGGGAGGLVYSRTMSLTPGTYQVVVGGGGPAGSNGGDSTFNGLVAYGGGYGSVQDGNGGNGGCGGGGSGGGGSPGTGSQGFPGGRGAGQYVAGGGGGGMGATASTSRPNVGNGATYVNGFQGGDGVQVQITGTPTYYAGGGGGGGGNGVSGGAVGGQGGGGTGGGYYAATAGTAGLGGGGGAGAAGGCGTVILAYLLPGQIATVTTPSVASGLIFWLDGADPAGTGVLPANGASITTWVDKSGNGKNATASAAATYSLASKALVFTGAQYYTTPFTTVPTTISVFLVINIGGSGYMDMMAGVLQVISNGYSQHLTIPGGSTVVDGATMASGTNLLYNFTFDSSASAYMYYNGALTGTRNGSTSYTGSGSIVLGGSDGIHEAYTGTISEILIYNSVLSTTNRQKIEGYLAWKWGFASNLSASNPYKYDSPM